MNSHLRAPLTIDGISLGQTRLQVERRFGRGTTNSNPSWARYYPGDGSPASGALPVLVSFRPTWTNSDITRWRVQSLSGSVLRQGEATLLTAGDSAQRARTLLGTPDEDFQLEPGYNCMVFSGVLVTYEEHSGRVVEIALRFPPRLRCRVNPAPVPAERSDALAC